jgi:UTP--glucose-1-phosphate uridylyltransferase
VKITKAVITAAAEAQRALPLQTLIDRDGEEKTVLRIIVEQALTAGMEEICVVTWPGDEARYAQAVGKHAGHTRFIAQPLPLGYGHAIYCARAFTGGEPFLHLVGDHLYVSSTASSSARSLVELAEAEQCAASAVQPTRENLLPNFGAVGGRRVAGSNGVYRVDTVIEKPTPTEAEQRLIVPGMRAGYYLCFFGVHVLTPAVMEILERRIEEGSRAGLTLSAVLAELARREQYLAVEATGRRYDLGVRYGLLSAQLALALSGSERTEVLANLCELLADRELASTAAEPAR